MVQEAYFSTIWGDVAAPLATTSRMARFIAVLTEEDCCPTPPELLCKRQLLTGCRSAVTNSSMTCSADVGQGQKDSIRCIGNLGCFTITVQSSHHLYPLALPADENTLSFGVDAFPACPSHHLLVSQRVHEAVLVRNVVPSPCVSFHYSLISLTNLFMTTG